MVSVREARAEVFVKWLSERWKASFAGSVQTCQNMPELPTIPRQLVDPCYWHVYRLLWFDQCVCKGLSDLVEYRFVCRVKVTEARSEGCKLKFSFANLKDRACAF